MLEIEYRFYQGNFLIGKPLTMRGTGHPALSGAQQGDMVRVTAPDVVLEGPIVRDAL